MLHTQRRAAAAAGIALALALLPASAFAAEPTESVVLESAQVNTEQDGAQLLKDDQHDELMKEAVEFGTRRAKKAQKQADKEAGIVRYTKPASSAKYAAGTIADKSKSDKSEDASDDSKKADAVTHVLSYDRSLIEQIGTQEKTGHNICCPSFSCAYADAVMDGTVHSHEYYTCSCCTWTDWGGGGSSNRCVGSDEELLREAYDQISAGKPTVIHVAASYGEHWIALIGYKNATDPDHLTLSNFVALDPWDGAEINPGERFTLYGDGCEHISDR